LFLEENSLLYELRKWELSDAEDVAYYANNHNISSFLRNGFPHPYTVADAVSYIHSFKEDDPSRICRAIVMDGRAAGSIGVFMQADVYEKSAEIGYWLGEPFWNQGIMTDAIRRMCAIAFKRLPIIRIYAEPFAHNKASRHALEKAGFVLEGILKDSIFKNGHIYDSCIYALLK
jgi:ribosomal-protein-alanine N-acetyltransferase